MAEWVKKYEGFSSRERMLIVAVLLFVLYFLMDQLLLSGLNTTQQSRQDTLSKLQQERLQLETQITLFSDLSSSDPDKAKKQQVQVLTSDLERLDDSLSKLSVGLIPADELPVMLQQALAQARDLSLIEVQTLPITQLSLQGKVLNKDYSAFKPAADDQPAGVYKHPVAIHVKGSYFDIKRYIEALENLSWRLYWQELNYRVVDYPNAQAILQVYTLSTEEGAFSE